MSLEVTLINPPILKIPSPFVLKPTPPLGLSLIAAQIENEGFKVNVIDCIAEDPKNEELFSNNIVKFGLSDEEILKKIDPKSDVIGISCMFSDNWLHSKILIDKIGEKFNNVKIIAGGEHITAAVKSSLEETKHLYAAILGEGESTIVDFLSHLKNKISIENCPGIAFKKNGLVIINNRRNRITEPDKVSWPAWHLFPIEKYRTHNISYGVTNSLSLPILATRGCPYECTFCSSPQMWGRKYVMRQPEEVFNEIKYFHEIYGAKNFDFYDLTAILKREWIISFSKFLIESNINITWQIPAGTRAEAIDFEVAQHLYKSGCRFITYAPETGSERMLKIIKKRVRLKAMLNSIKSSHKAGLNVKLNMIIGFPEETHIDILKTWWFLIKCSWYGAYDAFPSIFSAYPGSKMFDDLSESNLIPNNDELYLRILGSSSLNEAPNYCNDVSKNFIIFYFWFISISFYTSNYLFRPYRFIKFISGLFTKKYTSRAQLTLGEYLNTKVFVKNSKSKSIESTTY